MVKMSIFDDEIEKSVGLKSYLWVRISKFVFKALKFLE